MPVLQADLSPGRLESKFPRGRESKELASDRNITVLACPSLGLAQVQACPSTECKSSKG